MGRPVKSVYFGNRNTDGVAGEGVATATVGVKGDGYWSANAAATFTAPQIAGGTTATATLTFGNVTSGNIASVVITNAGSGYTSAPTLRITGANTTPASSFTVTLTNTTTDAITCNAWVTGDTIGRVGDIVKQTGSRTFRVATATDTGKCKLVTTAGGPAAAGEMTITATKPDSSTFNIAKINDRTVYDASGNKYQWVLGAGNATTDPVTGEEIVGLGSN
jgi:hypothetical protein